MENTIIKKHNFETAKAEIKKKASNVPSTVSINQFPTKGSIFPWNNHNITGSEANELLVSPLQTTLINQNDIIKSLFSIINEVYKALDLLDKEYIQSIIIVLKAAEIASNQAKIASSDAKKASSQALEASKEALEASQKAKIAQDDIRSAIEALKITVSSFKSFKEKVSTDLNSIPSLNSQIDSVKRKIQNIENRINEANRGFAVILQRSELIESQKHYGDVDSIWEDVNKHKSVIDEIISSLDTFIKRIDTTNKETQEAIENLTLKIKSYSHLDDIDTIWNDVEGHKTNLEGLHKQLDTFVENVNLETLRINSNIADLQDFRAILESYNHLSDIDTIWSDVERNKTNVEGLHKQLDTFVENVNLETLRINSNIADLQDFRAILESYNHLSDIDTIWNEVEGNKTNLAELHKQLDKFVSETHESISLINNTIDDTKEQSINRDMHVDKKIKIAYGVAAGSVMISFIQLVLQLIGIL